jgi:hypothetical protein
MPGPQHARMSRPELERTIVSYASADYPYMAREHAVRAALRYNELLAQGLENGPLQTAITTIAGKLLVAMPAAPADLSGLTDAQLASLADSLELAFWDYHRRTYALGAAHEVWVKRGTEPSASDYLNTFLALANYVRAGRGLSAIP